MNTSTYNVTAKVGSIENYTSIIILVILCLVVGGFAIYNMKKVNEYVNTVGTVLDYSCQTSYAYRSTNRYCDIKVDYVVDGQHLVGKITKYDSGLITSVSPGSSINLSYKRDNPRDVIPRKLNNTALALVSFGICLLLAVIAGYKYYMTTHYKPYNVATALNVGRSRDRIVYEYYD